MSTVISDLSQRILDTFDWTGRKWQTAHDIALAARLDAAEVEGYIAAHPSLFITAPVAPGGVKIFAARNDPGFPLSRE